MVNDTNQTSAASAAATVPPAAGDGEDPFETGPRQPVSPFRWAFRIAVGLIVAASFGVWVYAYSGYADRPAPDLLGDRDLAVSAEEVCASALADVAAMPGALDAVNGPDRADQIRRSTERFGLMLGELQQLNLFDERDRQIFTSWLSDWEVLLDDRLRYADEIAVDDEAQFLVTDVGVRERLDRRITRFANTNLMLSCVAPTDIG